MPRRQCGALKKRKKGGSTPGGPGAVSRLTTRRGRARAPANSATPGAHSPWTRPEGPPHTGEGWLKGWEGWGGSREHYLAAPPPNIRCPAGAPTPVAQRKWSHPQAVAAEGGAGGPSPPLLRRPAERTPGWGLDQGLCYSGQPASAPPSPAAEEASSLGAPAHSRAPAQRASSLRAAGQNTSWSGDSITALRVSRNSAAWAP